ncbi:hypothetical protein P4S73_19765 [Paraglaciecola sp. Hal342]
MGQLAMDRAAYIQAKPFFYRYLEYSQSMVDLAADDIDAQWELSYANLAIGSVNTKLQQHKIAKNAFETALAIQYELVTKHTCKRYISLLRH